MSHNAHHNGHTAHHGKQHDIHVLAHAAHDAMGELIKERLKMKLQKNQHITEKIDALSDMGLKMIQAHIDEMFSDVTNDFKKHAENM